MVSGMTGGSAREGAFVAVAAGCRVGLGALFAAHVSECFKRSSGGQETRHPFRDRSRFEVPRCKLMRCNKTPKGRLFQYS